MAAYGVMLTNTYEIRNTIPASCKETYLSAKLLYFTTARLQL